MKPAIEGGNPVRKDLLIFGEPFICEQEIMEVVDTLRSGWLSTGPRTKEFEEEFKEYIGCKYAIALNSCTAGLNLALNVIGVKNGDEIITTPLTHVSVANAIVNHNAKPIFVDVDKNTQNIDPSLIEKKITSKTKAIIPVHLGGRPCAMNEIMEIAERNGLIVIEDAAHAIEAKYYNKKIGSIGDMTVFSFYATKNLTTGEGGMLTTNKKEWADKIKLLRFHGMTRTAFEKYKTGSKLYDVVLPGYSYNMTDIQAAIGLHQLRRLEENLKIREKYFHMYNEAFKNIKEIITPKEEGKIRHARHLYSIIIKTQFLKINRDKFTEALQAENISAGIHFPVIHLMSYYRKKFGYKRGDFPNAEYISERTISLPLSAKLTEKDVNDVIKAVKKIIGYYKL
jgi:dTDP-4-amino-4,6-dideoxygalactose transaminase